MGKESHGVRRDRRLSDEDRLRGRLATYLHRQYRDDHKIPTLARDLGSTNKAAENILNGHWPNDIHLAAILRRFGRDLWDAVFAPEIEPVLARLTQEERELEERLASVRARRRQAAGGLEDRPAAGAAAGRAARAPKG